MLPCVIHVGHEAVKIIKGHTLAYLTPGQYYNLRLQNNLENDNSANISAASEPSAEILLAFTTSCKAIFPGNHTPLRKVLLKDAKISTDWEYTHLKIFFHPHQTT